MKAVPHLPPGSARFWRITAGAVAALVVACFASLAWRVVTGPFAGRGVLLKIDEGPATLWLSDTGDFDSTLELHVERAARHRMAYAIDKSTYSTLRFVRYAGRILIANGEYVFAAYDPAADAILGPADLPFTIREGQGQVIASYAYGDQPAIMWHTFPRVREQRAGENAALPDGKQLRPG
jgi:hypothetical protein